jgi:hypothetical protein
VKVVIMTGVAHMRVRISIPVKPVTNQSQPVGIVIIPAGVAPMRMPSMKILIVAKPAMVPQLQRAQIAITAVGAAPTAKNMLQMLKTARHATERT